MQLSERLRALLGWKILGAGLYLVGLPLYLLVQQAGLHRSTLIPWTAFDLVVPIWPWLIVVYLGQLVLVGIPFLLISRFDRWLRSVSGLGVASGIVLLVHFAWPTHVDRPRVTGPLMAQLQAIDAMGSTFPSLHATCAIFAALLMQSLDDVPRWLPKVTWAWTALVLVSCVSLRQHGWFDLAAGAAIGSLAFLFVRVYPGNTTAS